MFTEALCLTQAPPCNPNLKLPAANFLRLCSNQRCFDYYKQFVDECSSVGVNLTMYLPAAASQALFCPGYFGGVCKEVPGEYPSFAVKNCVSCNMVCQCYFCVQGCNPPNSPFVTVTVDYTGCSHPDGTALLQPFSMFRCQWHTVPPPVTLLHPSPTELPPPAPSPTPTTQPTSQTSSNVPETPTLMFIIVGGECTHQYCVCCTLTLHVE